MVRGGVAGAMPMSPVTRSKRIWIGCAVAIGESYGIVPMLKSSQLGALGVSSARPGQAGRRNPPKRRRPWGHPMRQLLLDFTQAPAPTFANYVHGRNAELAHVLEAAVRGEAAERLIYMWGESAAGKTHLLKAAVAAAGERARYVPAAEFTGEDAHGILALDDAERLPEARQVELFNAFNEKAFSLLVVAAAAAPREVPLRRDLATRPATGLTYRVLGLNHARRDMGSLMAALDSLDRYSLETGRAITVPLLKAALA